MYNVLDVCRYIINYCNTSQYGISNLKLQKILYFVQAYFLITDTQLPCFNERIEAWDFGPVVPTAYHEFKQYGASNIPSITSYIEYNRNNIWDATRKNFTENIIRLEDREKIRTIVDTFANYTATDLVNLTHNQAPWSRVYMPGRNNEISNDSIRGYFNAR